MKSIILLSALVIWAMADNITDEETKAWEDFKVKYKKFYATPVEEQYRKTLFLDRWRWVKKHNDKYKRGEESFRVSISKFSDLTDEETYKLLGFPGFRIPDGRNKT